MSETAVVIPDFNEPETLPESGQGTKQVRKPETAVTVIVPTYNESENISELARRIYETAPGVTILVMDDSPDNRTAQAAKAAGCQVIQRRENRGLSRAVIEGIKSSRDAEIIIVMDADLQHPPEALTKMINVLANNDVVVASRWTGDGGVSGWNWKRVLISKIANFLAWPLARHIKDRTSGFFGFHRSIIDPANLNATGWKIGLEVIARGHYTTATEIPYTFISRAKGESKMSGKQLWEYLVQLFSLYVNRFKIINFMMVGGIGFAINMLVYWPLTLLFKAETFSLLGQHFYLPPFVISSLIAIASNYTLNKIWTFKGWHERGLSFIRYLSMALVTLVFDIVLLYVLADLGKLTPMLAAALAILFVFVVRYVIAKTWIWNK